MAADDSSQLTFEIILGFAIALVLILLLLFGSWYFCVFSVNKEIRRYEQSHLLAVSSSTPPSILHPSTSNAVSSRPPPLIESAPPAENWTSNEKVKTRKETRHNSSARPESFSAVEKNGLSLGIDIGTVHTRFATIDDNGNIRILPNEHGQNLTPTFIASAENHKAMAPVVFGSIAHSLFKKLPPTCVLNDLPRLTLKMNRFVEWDLFPPAVENGNGEQDVVNSTQENNDGFVECSDGFVELSPTVLLAIFLSYLKTQAETNLDGKKVTNVVLAIPCCFNDIQRQAYVDAARIAGFDKIRLYSKVALGILYYLRNSLEPNEIYSYKGYVLVFRFGGGSLEAAIAKIKRQRTGVIACAGSQHFGGADLTSAIYATCLKKLKEQIGGAQAIRDKNVRSHLLRDCEKKKATLSATERVTFCVEHDDEKFKVEYTREELEEKIAHLETDIPQLIDQVIADCNKAIRIERCDIGHVYLFGGSSRIPKVQNIIKQYFGSSAIVHISPLDDHAVVEGAAMQAAFMSNKPVVGMERTKLEEVLGFDIISPSSTVDKVGNGDGNVILAPTVHLYATATIPTEKSVGEVVMAGDTLTLRQSARFRSSIDNTVNTKVDISLKAPRNQVATSPVPLWLKIDENGVLKAKIAPDIALKKCYALSSRSIVESQKLLNRLENETKRRRRELEQHENVIEKIVHAVKGDSDNRDSALLRGEDYVS